MSERIGPIQHYHNALGELRERSVRTAYTGTKWLVVCDNEDCPAPPMSGKTKEIAIQKWNAREEKVRP